MWGICMSNFSPLASIVLEEEEVTDERTHAGWTPFLALSLYKISILSTSLEGGL